jgi:pyruvate ferredoxin oxidoreductase alpha subunit
VGPYALPFSLLDVAHPTSQGPFAMPDYYYELRHQQVHAMACALELIEELGADLSSLTAGGFGVVERYRLDDAERAVVCLGSTAGTVKDVIDELRDEGDPVGLLRIRSYRPFPEAAIRAALEDVPQVIVLDRADAPGARGPLATEVAATLYGSGAELTGYVYGLGGRELHPADIRELLAGQVDRFVGLRGASCPA